MATKHANILDDNQLDALLNRLSVGVKRPAVERAAFLLSFKSGLRVQEIAGLKWDKNILDASGRMRTEMFQVAGPSGEMITKVLPVLFVGSDIGKYGNERTIRMHPLVEDALMRLRADRIESEWVLPSGKAGASQVLKHRAHALKMRISRFYEAMGYVNCSSHSGRRTFITKAARTANFAGCSIVDVQKLAGHRDLRTTQEYIEVTANQADLIGLI